MLFMAKERVRVRNLLFIIHSLSHSFIVLLKSKAHTKKSPCGKFLNSCLSQRNVPNLISYIETLVKCVCVL